MPPQEEMFDQSINWQERLSRKSSQKFEILYPAQIAALELYERSFIREPNVAFELPTGSGKTLIALMILDFWLEQKKRVAVLCGTKNLARQFKDEADALGVTSILFEGPKSGFKAADKFKYARAQAIGILNYWGYINQGPGIEPADVLILDDAHLAENAAHGLYSLDLNKGKHPELFATVLTAIASRFPHYTRLAEYAAGATVAMTIIELLSFTDVCDIAPELASIFDKSAECRDAECDLYWSWRRVKPSLTSSLILVGPTTVSIRPGCYPLMNERHIRQPRQRIMLSATIGSPDDLSRRIGVPAIKNVPLAARYRSAVPGKRLLLFPDTQERAKELETLATEAALRLKRSVWLCSSGTEATTWADLLRSTLVTRGITDQPVWVAQGQAEEIDQFVDAKFGHLFTAGRYDGMDFEGDLCRLVVMPTLPTACGLYERFISENLADAAFMNARVMQRIKQGLGRATRNDHDYAIYVFLDSGFSSYFNEVYDQLPENVRKEVEFGFEICETPFEEILRTSAAFLRGSLVDIGFPHRVEHTGDDALESESSLANTELDYWHKSFITRSYDQAARDAEQVASALVEAGQPGYALFWRYLRAHAAYLRNYVDADAAGLAIARSEVVKVLDEPRQSSWFSRLSRLRQTLQLEQVTDDGATEEFDCIANAWNRLLDGELRNPAKHQSFIASIGADLGGRDHKRFCHAVRNVMRLIGWHAEVREKGEGETDVLANVSLGPDHYALVIEAKPGMEDEKSIPLRYIAQTVAQLTRYRGEERLRHHSLRAILISKAPAVDPAAAAAAADVCLLPQSSFEAVAQLAIAAFQRYAAVRTRKGLLPKRSECIEALDMTPRLLGLYDVAVQTGRILDEHVVILSARR